MTTLVEFALQGGATVLVEVPDTPAADGVTRGLRPGGVAARVVDEAKHTFEEAVDRVLPAADSAIGRLRSTNVAPDEIQVEFGLDLPAEAGAFIAAASTGANFKVVLTWRPSKDVADPTGTP